MKNKSFLTLLLAKKVIAEIFDKGVLSEGTQNELNALAATVPADYGLVFTPRLHSDN